MMRVGHVSGPFRLAGQNFEGDVSNAFTAWGQYIIHDILQTPDVHNDPETPEHFKGCKCTPDNEKDDQFFNFCHQIEFPDFRVGSDPVLDTVPCIFITRSQAQLVRTGPNSGIREQETANNFKNSKNFKNCQDFKTFQNFKNNLNFKNFQNFKNYLNFKNCRSCLNFKYNLNFFHFSDGMKKYYF